MQKTVICKLTRDISDVESAYFKRSTSTYYKYIFIIIIVIIIIFCLVWYDGHRLFVTVLLFKQFQNSMCDYPYMIVDKI